jgi:DegV family protein with EDD domain
MNFILTTDTSCDEYRNVLDKLNIPWIPLTFTIDGATFDDNFSSDAEYIAFYEKLKNGAKPTTSQITPLSHEEFFEKVISERKADAIIHLSLSSGLSETVNSAKKGAEDYMKRNPKTKIYIIDTLIATQGHNLLLYKAIKMRDQGLPVEKAYKELENLAPRAHGWFMVDNLFHLKRGGRVSGASAVIGTILNIKPLLIIDYEGKLKVVKKKNGVSQALSFILEMIKEYKTDDTDEFYIMQANTPKNAELLKERIKKEYPLAVVRIGWLGPIIGTHCGDGMLGVAFIGKDRKEIR